MMPPLPSMGTRPDSLERGPGPCRGSRGWPPGRMPGDRGDLLPGRPSGCRIGWLAWVALMGIPGCGGDATGPGPVPEGPALQTDQSSYQARYLGGTGTERTFRFELIARYTNLTDRDIYLARCRPEDAHPLHSVDGEGFQSAYGEIQDCSDHRQPIRVRPGRTRVDTLFIQGPTVWDGAQQPLGYLHGEFRLRYSGAFCRSGCEEYLPDSLRASEPFTVAVDGWPAPLPSSPPGRAP